MKTTLIAISTAAVMGLGAPALAQQAVDQQAVDEQNMMIGSAYVALVQAGYPTEGLQNLSVSQLTQISVILEEMEGQPAEVIRQAIEQVMASE